MTGLPMDPTFFPAVTYRNQVAEYVQRKREERRRMSV
jgi:hypothetical protein